MATLISTFREPIRAFLLDNHPLVKQYHADQLDAAVKLVVNLGKVPGVKVSENGLSLEPDVNPASENAEEAKNWARVVLHSAKRFVTAGSMASGFRTRAISEYFGEAKMAVFDILMEVYDMEFGEGGE